MKLNLYKIVGWILIVLGCIPAIYTIALICLYFYSNQLPESLTLYPLSIALLLFQLGKEYLKIASDKHTKNWLTHVSLFFSIVPIIFFLGMILLLFSWRDYDLEGTSAGFIVMFDFIGSLLLYFISIIFIIVSKFKYWAIFVILMSISIYIIYSYVNIFDFQILSVIPIYLAIITLFLINKFQKKNLHPTQLQPKTYKKNYTGKR